MRTWVREKTDGGQDWFKVYKGLFDNSTFIPGTALSFVETKAGKGLVMGGSHVLNASPYSVQKELVRDLAIGSKAIKATGNILGGIGIGFTLYDMKENGINTSNSLDAAMGIVSFIPGGGWIAGGIYFIGNGILEATTGKNAGQWIDVGIDKIRGK